MSHPVSLERMLIWRSLTPIKHKTMWFNASMLDLQERHAGMYPYSVMISVLGQSQSLRLPCWVAKVLLWEEMSTNEGSLMQLHPLWAFSIMKKALHKRFMAPVGWGRIYSRNATGESQMTHPEESLAVACELTHHVYLSLGTGLSSGEMSCPCIFWGLRSCSWFYSARISFLTHLLTIFPNGKKKPQALILALY